jgi:hypothetical protein
VADTSKRIQRVRVHRCPPDSHQASACPAIEQGTTHRISNGHQTVCAREDLLREPSSAAAHDYICPLIPVGTVAYPRICVAHFFPLITLSSTSTRTSASTRYLSCSSVTAREGSLAEERLWDRKCLLHVSLHFLNPFILLQIIFSEARPETTLCRSSRLLLCS